MNTKFKINSTDFIQICILSIFVIGNFFDYRLEINGFNISYIFTTLYLAAFLFIIASKKFDKSLSSFILLFYLMILTQTMINWSIWGINEYENYSLNKFFILSSITLPMCLYVSTLDSIEKLKNIVKQISFVGGFLFIISIMQIFFSGINLGEQRMSVLGGGAIVFSRWVGIFFLAVFYDIINLKKMKFIILGLCFFLMLYSGSRGPILFLLLIIFTIRTVKLSYFLFFSISLICLVLANYDFIINWIDVTPVLSRVFGFSPGSSLIDGSSSTMRMFLYYDSYEIIKNNIFGYGLGNFSIYSDSGQLLGYSSYPHNFLLEIFSEHGILVFSYVSLIIASFFRLFFYWIKKDQINKEKKIFFAIWLFCFLNSLVSGDLSDSRILIFFSCVFYMYSRVIFLDRGGKTSNLNQ